MCTVLDQDVTMYRMFTLNYALFVATVTCLFSLPGVQRVNGYGPPRTFGLYKLVLKEVEVCGELKSNYFSAKLNESNNVMINSSKGGTSELEDFHITLVSNLSDDVSGVYKVHMLRQDGDWSLLHSLIVPRACSDTALVVPELLDVLLTTGSPADTCLVPKGNYRISRVEIGDLKLSNYPYLPYSKYKIDFEVLEDKTVVGCIALVVDVSPPENNSLLH